MADTEEANGWDRRTMIKGAAGVGAATALASVLTTSQTASAAVDLGGSLDGIGTFAVLAFSWGASNVGSGQRGAGAAGRPSLQDLSITKYTDADSPKILDALLRATRIPSATITVTPSTPFPRSTYALENVLVSSYSSGGSGGEDRLTENISLSFTKLTYTVGGTSVVWP